MAESIKHLVATRNDVYIVYDYDKDGRRRIRGIKGMRSAEVIPPATFTGVCGDTVKGYHRLRQVQCHSQDHARSERVGEGLENRGEVMSYYVLTMPLCYVAIVGLEYVFWRRRFEEIKHQIPINLFILTLVAGFLGLAIWFERHIDLCWKFTN